jgi:hypothetical protein
MKTYGGVEKKLHAFLNQVNCQVYIRENSPGTHWIGRWVGFNVGLVALVKRKIPVRYQAPRSPARSLVVMTDSSDAADKQRT